MNKLSQKKYREQFGEFTIEGIKGVKEAFLNGAEVVWLIVEEKRKDEPEIRELCQLANSLEVAFAAQKDIGEIKSTKLFPGVMAVVKQKPVGFSDVDRSFPIVCLDGVQDPGNLGTILRTADWFGFQNILLSEDCVDVYNEKVVRSSMGSIFRLNVFKSANLSSDLLELKQQGYRLCGLTLEGSDCRTLKDEPQTVYIFGSESHGVRPEIQQLIDQNYTIPRFGASESLNVGIAVGVILSQVALGGQKHLK